MKQVIALLSATLMFVLTSLAVADDLQSELTAMEKSLWTATTKKDPEPFRKLVAEDAVQITASGVLTGREAIVKDNTSCDVRSFTLHDVKLHHPGRGGVALHRDTGRNLQRRSSTVQGCIDVNLAEAERQMGQSVLSINPDQMM